jgi:cyclopropane-fatty-acyl-phospholipid synthase
MAILERLRVGALDLVTPDGNTYQYRGELDGPHATLVISEWDVLARIALRGDIGFAEGYLDGTWDTPDLNALLMLAARNRSVLEAAIYGQWWGNLLARVRHLFLHMNTRRGARRNISAHYDLGNEFYAAWLDPSMTYSAALFGSDRSRSLEEAQQAKYQRVLDTLKVSRGASILEIGCGWGGFAEYAARTRGCRVHGISLSTEQLNFAHARVEAAGLADRCTFSLTDYRDLQGQFDCIVSIEMFEAVGERYWRDYFRTLKDRLAPHGQALVQTITIADSLFERYRTGTDFIQQYVFPGGMLPSRQVFVRHAQEACLRVADVFAFGPDYAETLRRWQESYVTAAPRLRSLGFDERFERLWTFYLAYCIAGFATGNTDVLQVVMTRA